MCLTLLGHQCSKEFARAILAGDEATFQSLLVQGGIQRGSICAEGRVAATVLPTNENSGWQQFNIPFVLQTAIIRRHKEILVFFEKAQLNWEDLTERLPMLTNTTEWGFHAPIGGYRASELAKRIWEIARTSLNPEEVALIGNTIDRILNTHKAPAEEQIDFLSREKTRSLRSTLPRLIDHLSIKGMPRPNASIHTIQPIAIYSNA